MNKSKFSEAQIVEILREGEAGVPVAETLRWHGISRLTFYLWKLKYGIAAHATATPVLGRGFGADQFVRVNAGRFTMGAIEVDDNTPHAVILTRACWLQKTPVTQAQWVTVMGENPSLFDGDDLRPVETVSWDDVQQFLRRLNQQTGQAYRLPTEAEWDYGFRAGTTDDYPDHFHDVAWYLDNSGGTTHTVATLLPNAWGLFDMHGNVSEWVQDWYAEIGTEAAQDPTGPSSGRYRVRRGCSWVSLDHDARSANRDVSESSDARCSVGFRLARTA